MNFILSSLVWKGSSQLFCIVVHRDIMNNKVFYQHPDLMRALGMHETVMEVMVNVLGEGESKVRAWLKKWWRNVCNLNHFASPIWMK